MTVVVLDTDILVLFQEGHEAVCRRVLAQPLDQLATTVITVEEQLSGWYTLLRRVKDSQTLARAYGRLADCVRLLSRFEIFTFTETAIERFERLKGLKLKIRRNDLRIAAIVLEHSATLATRNTRDFKHIPDLEMVDWST